MKNYKWFYSVLLLSLSCACILIVSNCKKENNNNNNNNASPVVTHPYKFPPLPYYFPTAMNIPADNPMTVEGVKLGRYLYYDGRIDGRLAPDSQMCCATCHIQAYAFTCGINNPKFIGGHPFGVTGILSPHYMLPHINLVFDFNGYLWSGKVCLTNMTLGSTNYGVPAKPEFDNKNVESLFWMGVYAPHEFHTDSTQVIHYLKNVIKYPNYPNLFKAAFGTSDITMQRIGKAIAQFVRTLISYNSKYDQVNQGQAQYTPSEARGHDLFVTEPGDCFHCHGNPALLTNNLYMNNAKDSIFNSITSLADRFSYTHDSVDIGCYKVPTLRNIELTGPYMHDGRYKTLQDVANHYSSELIPSKYVSPLMLKLPYGGDQFTQPQIDDLIAYLKTFTDYQFISDTNFAKPSDYYLWR